MVCSESVTEAMFPLKTLLVERIFGPLLVQLRFKEWECTQNL